MSLTDTFVEAELAAGKSHKQLMDDLSKATGYTVGHSTLSRWRHRHRNPEPAPRQYMLRKAIPHVIKGITPKQVEALVEALS